MRLDVFCEVRPNLYHLTARANLARIQRLAQLDPATTLLTAAGCQHLSRTQRSGTLTVTANGERICIRDQDPLKEANCHLDDGFSFEDLLDILNQHVFFWPGRTKKPVLSGCNHFARYAPREDAVVLKFPTRAVIEANPNLAPRFSKYNSGAPRPNPRTGKSPRGPALFLPAEEFPATPGRVVEVVFKGTISLPLDTVTVSPVQQWLPRADGTVPTHD